MSQERALRCSKPKRTAFRLDMGIGWKERSMSEKIEGTAEEALAKVQKIVAGIVPDAICELQDYQQRIGCGAVDRDGNVVDIVMLRRGLDVEQVNAFADDLARKASNSKDRETQEWLDSMKPLPPSSRVV